MAAPALRFWEKYEASTAAWREKRRLASALRALAEVCVTTDAPDSALSEAADIAQHLVNRLGAHPRRTFQDGWPTCKSHDDFAVFIDRHPLTGESNPYAPPLHLHVEGDTAVGLVTFGPMFEGVPGHVHGGLVSAAFDQVFGYLMVSQEQRAMTGSLSVRYRKPTPFRTELRFEANVDRVDGRRYHLRARALAGVQVTADAEAIFVTIDAEHLASLAVPNAASNPSAGTEG